MQDIQQLEARIKGLSPLQKKWLANQLRAHSQDTFTSGKLVACVKTSQPVSAEDLKARVRSYMPDHCVPQGIYNVQSIPRKAEGKVDRSALQYFPWQLQTSALAASSIDLDKGGDQADDYFVDFVAPRNAIEQTLAEIWQEVLGLSEISIHDDFLEVGGDSLLSIRILARANKAGLSINPQDFFDLPTIAQQAERVSQASTVSRATELSLSGKFNLTPIQHWFFQRVSLQQHHWQQNVLLQLPKSYSMSMIEQAVETILLHHDVLRSKFVYQDEKWQQEIQQLLPLLPIRQVNFSEVADAELDNALAIQTDKVQIAMSLDASSLIQFLFVRMPKGTANKLVIIAHHLIIDAQSWRILLEDLQHCLQASQQQQKITLAPKTHSFKLWSARLEQFAKQQNCLDHLPYWQKHLQDVNCNLPTDFTRAITDNLAVSQKVYRQVFSSADTQKILNQLKLQQTSIQKGLTHALVKSLWQWSKQNCVMIDIESHGREALFADLDLSRSMGWYTAYYPVAFNQPEDKDQWTSSITQCLDKIPQNGISYGVLRELYRDETLRNQQSAQICFNYLGQLDKLTSQTMMSDLKLENENIGTPRSPLGRRTHLLEINAMITGEKLVLNWAYSERFHRHSSLVHMGELLAKALMNKTLYKSVKDASGQNPTFDLANLDNEDMGTLADILSRLDEQ